MYVTEDESGYKFCPLARPAFEAATESRLCIGSGCMAWRWDAPPRQRSYVCDEPQSTAEPKRPYVVPASWTFEPYDASEDAPALWREPEEEAEARREGYCGMAGQPTVKK